MSTYEVLHFYLFDFSPSFRIGRVVLLSSLLGLNHNMVKISVKSLLESPLNNIVCVSWFSILSPGRLSRQTKAEFLLPETLHRSQIQKSTLCLHTAGKRSHEHFNILI